MSTRVALSPNDSLWLNMDTPQNLMTIESVMWFDEPLDAAAVLQTLRTRLIERYPVFTWRPEFAPVPGGLDHWVADEAFSLERHVTFHELDGHDGHDAIQRFLEAEMSQPLPRDRPMWHAHVLSGAGAHAVVMRFHHAIADGTALVRVLLDLTTDRPEGDSADPTSGTDSAPSPPERAGSPAGRPSAADRVPVDSDPDPAPRVHQSRRERAVGALSHAVTWPLAAGVAATNTAADLAASRDPAGGRVRRVAEQARGTADAVEKLLVGTAPDALPFGRPGRAKSADWGPPYPLSEVKRVARARGATVNDVMMAALSGALRRYVIAHGEVPRDVVTMIPVNLRPWDAPLPEHLGNKFALVALELPLALPTPTSRLAESKARMDVIKQGPEALLTFGLAHAIGSVGSVTGTVSRQMISYFGNKAFGVTTNVPGPTSVRYFAGRELVGVLGWVPGASHQTLGACIFSYNGQVRVGFKADSTVIPDVENLVAALDDEMADLFGDVPDSAPEPAVPGPGPDAPVPGPR
jgi:WS/DGAT/MGAT family acyltransferase